MKKLLIFKRRAIFLLLLIALLSPFKVMAGNQVGVVSLSFSEAKLSLVLEEIEKQSSHYFVFNHQTIAAGQKVSYSAKEKPLPKVLEELLHPLGISYNMVGKQIVLKREKREPQSNATTPLQSSDQNDEEVKTVRERVMEKEEGVKSNVRTIEGIIRDESGEPMAGVSIFTADKRSGLFSNIDGSYKIAVSDTVSTLIFSYVGFETRYISIIGRNRVDVTLKEEANRLSDVIVTGYQSLSKERATGSFSVLSSRELETRLETNISSKFEGMIPGLFVSGGAINIRGISTIHGTRTPLYVVDGFPYEGSISRLNPADIVNITVLKDAAAASIYGARAANGVIVITTDTGRESKLSVSYNSSFFLTPLQDESYLELMNSKEIVDLQAELFEMGHNTNSYKLQRMAKPAALQYLYDHELGELTDTELEEKLEILRGLDNRAQLREHLLQNAFKHQHSLTLSGGNKVNRYYISGNIIENRGYNVGGSTENININLKDYLRINDWLLVHLGISTSFDKSITSPTSATGYYRSRMPYEMLLDEDGELTSWRYMKSEMELERLRSLGLYDESYNPLRDRDHIDLSSRGTYVRL